jgi:hypothetical protein
MAGELSGRQKSESGKSRPTRIHLSCDSVRLGPQSGFAAGIFIALAVWVTSKATLAPELVMPLLVGVFLILAGTFAMMARWSRSFDHAENVTYADVAGALTLIGLCVGATIDPDQIVRLVHSGTAEN